MNTVIDISGTVIDTERLILRGWRETDLNDLYEYASVDGVGEMAGWPHHRSVDESRRILQEMFLPCKSVFAVELKENGKVIGSVGLHKSWAEEDPAYFHMKTAEVGYALSKTYWGKGLMPEAVAAVIKFTFARFDLDALTCSHYTFNNQSRRVIEKCGFTFVEQGQSRSEQLQKTFDSLQYILYRAM